METVNSTFQQTDRMALVKASWQGELVYIQPDDLSLARMPAYTYYGGRVPHKGRYLWMDRADVTVLPADAVIESPAPIKRAAVSRPVEAAPAGTMTDEALTARLQTDTAFLVRAMQVAMNPKTHAIDLDLLRKRLG